MAFVILVIALVVVLLASIILAVILSWVVGAATGLIQHRRQPDFRERGRPGEPEPPPGATPGQPSLQGTPGRWSRGRVSPAGFEPALPTSSRWCLLPLGYEDLRSWPPQRPLRASLYPAI